MAETQLNLFSLKIANTYVAGQTTTTTTYTIGEKSGCSLDLHALRFNRKLYQPGEIEAEISIKPALAVSDVVTAFLNQKVELTLVSASKTIANNYYVHELLPQKKKGDDTILYIKLLIYSMDKVMTLDKYSKVYVGKKLGSGILETEAKNFTLGTNAVSVSCENLRHLKYEQEMLVKKNVTSKVKINNIEENVTREVTTTIRIPSEFIQPYLVQYNESFYDFLARTANRCGEFLYFEDGRLNLGVPYDTKTKATEIKEYASVTYQNVSSSPMSVKFFSHDSMKKGQGSKDKTNSTCVDRNAAGFPEDVFPEETMYNAEQANDEYFFPLYADRFTSVERELGYDQDAGVAAAADLFPDISTIINSSDNIVQLGLNLVEKYAKDTKFAFITSSRKNEKGNKKHINTYDNTEHGNGEKAVQFGTLSPDGWTKLSYYQDVRKYAEEVQKGIVCIKVDPNFNTVKLGDKITIGTDTKVYVVIQIIMEGDRTWNCDYTMEECGVAPNAGTPIQKIFALPLTQDNQEVYPPVQSIPVVRKAEPQTAYVTNNSDPKYQGRVRIVYPWQSPQQEATLPEGWEAAQKELIAAKKDFKDKKNAYKQKEREFNELKAELNDLETNLERTKEKYDEKIKECNILIAILEEANNNFALSSDDTKAWENYFKDKWSTSMKSEMTKEEFLNYISTLSKANLPAEIHKLKSEKIRLDNYYKEYLDPGNSRKSRIDYCREETTKDFKNNNKENKTTKTEKEDAYKAYIEAKNTLEERQQNLDKLADQYKSMLNRMSSPWIRVSTPMATDGGGTYFRPNVGDEVLINYDSGNIERPYVVGSLFSKNLLVPNELASRTKGSGDASISIVSANGHGITFKDPSDGNKFLKSMFPMLNTALQYPDVSDDFGFPKEAAGGIRIGDRYGLYTIDMSSDKRSVKISSSMGTVSLNAFTGITISAPNGDVTIEGKNVNIKAGNNLSLTSGINIEKGWLFKDGKGFVKDLVGDPMKAIAKNEFAPFLDLSLERQLIEVVLRPIEGTLCVKSKRYLMLEAGKGSATVAADQYKPTKTTLNEGAKFIIYSELTWLIDYVCGKFETFANEYGKLYRIAKTAKDTYDNVANDLLVNSYDVLNAAFNNNIIAWTDVKDDEFSVKNYNDPLLYHGAKFSKKSDVIKYIKNKANDYGKAVFELREFINDYKGNYASLGLKSLHVDSELEKLAKKWFDTICDDIQKKWEDQTEARYRSAFFSQANPPQFFDKTVIKRKWAASFIYDIAGPTGMLRIKPFLRANFKESEITDTNLLNNWVGIIGKVDVKPDDSVGWTIGKALVDNSLGALLKSFNPKELYKTFIRNIWDDRKPGQILMSAKAGTTYTLDEDGKWKKKLDDSFETLKNKLINIA